MQAFIELFWLFLLRGIPEILGNDNGPEFRSKAVDEYLRSKRVIQEFTLPGSPWQIDHVESFFGKLRFTYHIVYCFCNVYHLELVIIYNREV